MNRKRVLKWILAGVGVLLGLGVVASIMLVVLVDPNDFRKQIAEKVTEQTGRDFQIEGEIGYSFFPWLGLELGAMELGNAQGFDEQPFARIESADAKVKLLPLFSMQVEMDTVTLHGLALRLQKKADGTTNWDDLTAAGEEEEAAPEPEEAPKKSAEELLEGLAINGIEVRDASVLWDDAQGGQRAELKKFDLTTGTISLAEPIPLELSGEVSLSEPELSGSFSFSSNVALALDEERYRLDTMVLKADLSSEVIPGGKLKAELQADAMADLKQQLAEIKGLKLMTMGSELTGEVSVTRLLEEPAVEGNISLKVNDGKAATTPVADALPAGFKAEGLNGAMLATTFQVDLGEAQSLRLSPFKLSALGIELNADVDGSAIIDDPRFQGGLKTNAFVPRQIMSQLGITLPEMADPSAMTKAALNTRFDAGLDHASLNKLVVQFDQSTLKGNAGVRRFDAPVVRYDLQLDNIDVDRYLPPPSEAPAETQATAQAGGEEAAGELPLEMLRSLDIDGRFRIGKVKVMNLTTETIDTNLKAENGLFRLHPVSARLYEGGYKGDLGLDVQGDTPKVSMNEMLSGVQAGPLLKDFLGKDYVTGKANVAAKLTAQGLEPMAIRQSLNGNGNFSFDDGQINGLNIGQRIREAYALYKREPKPDKELKKTDFSQLSGSFTVTNGLVKTSDLKARSTLFQVDGKGNANLVSEKLDMRLDTKVVSDIRDATGQRTGELTGEVIPVTIKGSFSEPDISVDIKSVLKAKAKGAIDEKKREAQEKLDRKKREAEEKVERKKQEAETKAKERVEEKKEELKEDVKDKLKDMIKF